MSVQFIDAILITNFHLLYSPASLSFARSPCPSLSFSFVRAELLSSAKDVQAMADARHENENLREQVKLLKQSMQALFDNQRKAQEEVEYLRKVQSKGTRSRVCGFLVVARAFAMACTILAAPRVATHCLMVISRSIFIYHVPSNGRVSSQSPTYPKSPPLPSCARARCPTAMPFLPPPPLTRRPLLQKATPLLPPLPIFTPHRRPPH